MVTKKTVKKATVSEKLAIDGGKPVNTKPFPGWPSYEKFTADKVAEVLLSGKINYWTGKVGMQFEAEWAKWLGIRNAVSVTNGTAALHVALGGLNIVNERTKAIVVVHLYGIVADMDPIMKIARKHGLKVIEDCAQCFGGVYKGKKAGTIGDVGCFSFCQSKHFSTGGEGGMVVTNDDDLAWEFRSFRDHGYDVQAKMNLLEMEGKQLYIHRRVGFNFRMTEMQSMIGLCELKRFDSWNLPNRIKNGEYLIKELKDHPLVYAAPLHTKERRSAFWWAPFVLNIEKFKKGITMKEFLAAMGKEGVPVYSVLWPEMYKEEAFANRRGFGSANYPFYDPRARVIDYTKFNCEHANWLTDRTMCFFVHPVYGEEQMKAYVAAFKKVAAAYMK